MRCNRNVINLSNLFYFSIMLCLLSGCATTMSTFTEGGTVVPKDYDIQKIIVAYLAYGNVSPDVQYSLVETPEGLAIFEKKLGDYGFLHQAHWRDDQADRFASWVIPLPGFSTIVARPIKSLSGCCGTAYEFVVPFDRSEEARMYRYPKQTYTIKKINWVKRPVPNDPETKPIGRLVPK